MLFWSPYSNIPCLANLFSTEKIYFILPLRLLSFIFLTFYWDLFLGLQAETIRVVISSCHDHFQLCLWFWSTTSLYDYYLKQRSYRRKLFSFQIHLYLKIIIWILKTIYDINYNSRGHSFFFFDKLFIKNVIHIHVAVLLIYIFHFSINGCWNFGMNFSIPINCYFWPKINVKFCANIFF